jgi:hypothetical protein
MALNKVVFRDVKDRNTDAEEKVKERRELLQKIAANKVKDRSLVEAERKELQKLQTTKGQPLKDPLLLWTTACVNRSFGPVITESTARKIAGAGRAGFAAGAARGSAKNSPLANVSKWMGIYGLLSLDGKVAPDAFDENPEGLTADQLAARDVFYRGFFAATSEYQASEALFQAVLDELRKLGERDGTEYISAKEWAGTVRALVQQRVSDSDPQLGRKVNVALGRVQRTGEDLPPSAIEIDVPDLEQATETTLSKDNLTSHIPSLMCMMLEELKVPQVVDKLVELFQNGLLPIGRGEAGNFLYKYWRESALRIGEPERRSIYARAFGAPGGDDVATPNREFNDLWLRFISSVSSFVRQSNVDRLLRNEIPNPVSQQQVRKSAWDLAANLSMHGFGISYFAATELQQQLKDMIQLLSAEDIRAAYGARDMWQVVDQVAGLELGGARNSVKYRTMATAGAIIIAWLAKNAERIQRTYDDLIDMRELRFPPTRRNGSAINNPSDYDMVNACEQWLAVAAIEESRVEEYAQSHEAPLTTGRPIQIPSIAREMLDSMGVPSLGMDLGAPVRRGNGQPRAQH